MVTDRNWFTAVRFADDRWVFSEPVSEADAVHHARAYIEQQGAVESYAAEIKRRFTAHVVEVES